MMSSSRRGGPQRSRRNTTDGVGNPPSLADAAIPLVRRFPALAAVPRARLGRYPSPVERCRGVAARGELWLKRDDLNAPAFGGNKVRALEFLLGGVAPGDELLTVGGEGSTHVLTTAALARALGARTTAVRWRHEMNPVARAVARRAREEGARVLVTTPGAVSGMLAALLLRTWRGARWIPLGGTTPLGMLGHVNAALELAEQVERGELPAPEHVVVPLGSGGTAAGLALGFAIAGLDATVVAARVAPRVATGRRRVLSLARSCASLIARLAGEPPTPVRADRVRVVHDVYGGAYGRALAAGRDAAAALRHATGIALDDTYAAKALAAAVRLEGRVLFWVTFDGRWLG
ncbi:MAG TPA: pyridoxal-phosphate dependent enzyme [Gemmatimonadaceae bacterium]|nr:pyridoxal-phosphate dependent enzyme [Gemmatimonadaceae bacterium]